MKLSDKIILSVVAMSILSLTVDYMRSGPDPVWSQVKKGMTASEIHQIIGPAEKSKQADARIEIWWRKGFLRSTSLAVLYYSQDTPETATHVCCSTEKALDKFIMWIFSTFIM